MKEKEYFFIKIKNYLDKQGLCLDDILWDKIWSYFNCLNRVNRNKNLVSNNVELDAKIEMFCDSFFAAIYIANNCFCSDIYDIGSGAGFPGIIIALVNSDKCVYLVESSRKKCSFLLLVKTMLKIDNLVVINDRVENINNKQFIISKAAFSIKTINCLKNIIGKDACVVFLLTSNQLEDFRKALLVMGEFVMKVERYCTIDRERYLLVADRT